MSRNNLKEIMDEYHEGYEKAYKNIPDLVEEIKRLRKIEAAAKLYVEPISGYVREVDEITTARRQALTKALEQV